MSRTWWWVVACAATVAPYVGGCAEGTQVLGGPDGTGDVSDGTGDVSDDGGSGEATDDAARGEDAASPPDVPADDADDGACGTATFEVVETQEVFSVPPGVRFMHVKVWGSGANGETLGCGFDDSGLGGYTEAVFEVTPMTPLIVIVGGAGSASAPGTMYFGWGSDGGGGLSGVFVGPDPITENDSGKALIIAGGGGGAWPGCFAGGTGNHATAAGGMTTMLGGRGSDGVNGGGGGYRGGTGGARREVGKGGTGWVTADRAGFVVRYSEILASEPGAGVPPNTEDPDYDGIAGKGESPGRIVMHFTCEPPPFI